MTENFYRICIKIKRSLKSITNVLKASPNFTNGVNSAQKEILIYQKEKYSLRAGSIPTTRKKREFGGMKYEGGGIYSRSRRWKDLILVLPKVGLVLTRDSSWLKAKANCHYCDTCVVSVTWSPWLFIDLVTILLFLLCPSNSQVIEFCLDCNGMYSNYISIYSNLIWFHISYY
jgi:hypothetical protein